MKTLVQDARWYLRKLKNLFRVEPDSKMLMESMNMFS